MQDQNNGPISNWLYAEMCVHLSFIPDENYAATALRQLEGEEHLNDFAQLANPDGPLGRALTEFARNIRQAPPDELEFFLPFCSEESLDSIKRTQKNSAAINDDFTLHLLDLIWQESGVKEQLRSRLKQLGGKSDAEKIQLVGGEK